MIDNTIKILESSGIEFYRNESLAKHTTIRIGGEAAVFSMPENPAELKTIFRAVKENRHPMMILGKGSNVLFSDRGYNGLIVRLSGGFEEVKVEGNTIKAGAGACLSQVCRSAMNASLKGISFAFGIPGSLGGAVFMNAGAYNGEMKDIVKSVDYMFDNGEVKTFSNEECAFVYRNSVFQKLSGSIISVNLELCKGDKGEIQREMDDFWKSRVDKQPLDKPSAGSAFKRPVGAYASQLIDSCGLRGLAVGDAAISSKHCGFIVNMGNATCKEVIELFDLVIKKVQEQTGYVLEKEIRVIGDAEAL